ncbi:hypothetical protein C9374_013856 [Naegleria lovaniensis]|uniref:Uncharacterized protein n=1 Tax=Naegleria lovaniensis TaxID=51637 RepID=A0AA88GVP4_NAELO|nr:uncharacterized protein C9374_013856 [Naegleria lovaniensis]KAG2389296.1 hypothetical protein C9374_013856 [Naegleria lovaniensis]
MITSQQFTQARQNVMQFSKKAFFFPFQAFKFVFHLWFALTRFFMFDLPIATLSWFYHFIMGSFVVRLFVLPIAKWIVHHVEKPIQEQLRSSPLVKKAIRQIPASLSPNQVKELKQEIEQKDQHIQTLLHEKSDLSRLLHDKELELNEKLQSSSSSIQLSEMESKISSLMTQLESLKSEKDKLVKEKNTLEHTSLSQLQMMKQVETMLNIQANKVKELELVKDQVRNEYEKILKENERLRSEHGQIDNQNKKQFDSLKKENDKLKREYDKLQQQNEKLESQISILNGQLSTLDQENRSLRETKFLMEKAQKEQVQREDAFQKLKQDLDLSNNKIHERDSAVNSLKHKVSEKEREVALLREQVRILDSELKSKSKESEMYSQRIDQLQQVEEISHSSENYLPTPNLRSEEEMLVNPQIAEKAIEEIEEENVPSASFGLMDVGIDEKALKGEAISASSQKKTHDQQEKAISSSMKEKNERYEGDLVSSQKEEKPLSKGLSKESGIGGGISQAGSSALKGNIDQEEVSGPSKAKIQSKDVDKQEVSDVYSSKYVEPQQKDISSEKPISKEVQQESIEEKPKLYQADDNYIPELADMLDSVEKGEIENVQFQSIACIPKLKGSLVNLISDQIDDILSVLQNSDQVSFVDFSDCGLDTDFAKRILNSIAINNSIEIMDLGCNEKVEPNLLVDDLINFFSQNKKCQKFLAKDWKFSDDNISKIINIIHDKNNSLTEFKFDDSNVSQDQIQLLNESTKRNVSAI